MFRKYMANWIHIFLIALFTTLVAMLIEGAIAPRSWWGDYTQPGISLMDWLMALHMLLLLVVIVPGLLWGIVSEEYRVSFGYDNPMA